MAKEAVVDDVLDHDAGENLTDRGDELVVEETGDEGATPEAGAKKDEETSDEKGKEGADEKTADEKGKDEVEKDVPNPMVPRARLTESQRKRKEAEARAVALEEELRELRDQGGHGKAFKEFTEKVDKLYEDVEVARAEGEYKKAAKLQRELDQMRDSSNKAQTEYIAQQRAVQAQHLAAYEAVVDQVELLVPELNPKHEEFSDDLLADVSAIRDGYEARGVAPAAALKRALKYVLGRDIFDEKSMRRESIPEKRKTDVKANVEAAKKQPPDTDKSAPTEKALSIDVSKLSDEEFDKLPEATKKRLRGDFVG